MLVATQAQDQQEEHQMARITSKLTFANVVASIALFAVLGGGAYAATKIDRNAVVSKSIKNQQVRSADLKNNNVRSKDVEDGTLEQRDLADGTIPTIPAVDPDPSRTYYDGSPATELTTPGSRVLEVAVPAGSYAVHADLLVYQAQGATGQADCRLRAPADSSTAVLLGYTGNLFLGDQANNIDSRFISMGGSFATQTGGVVELFCIGDLETQTGDMVVTEVSGIDNQS
jgi:hypothetical protein